MGYWRLGLVFKNPTPRRCGSVKQNCGEIARFDEVSGFGEIGVIEKRGAID
ncbi:MAG: hypothetical protein ACFKPT_13450 [Gloeotrichia echinulata GP01]